MKELQMTATGKPVAGAPSASIAWCPIDWQSMQEHVKRHQMRIAKAFFLYWGAGSTRWRWL
jgi:hypothetical protein